jgi:hypothetical protein
VERPSASFFRTIETAGSSEYQKTVLLLFELLKRIQEMRWNFAASILIYRYVVLNNVQIN